MDELKNIFRTALSIVEEITWTNTPTRKQTVPVTWLTGPELPRSLVPRTRTSLLVGTAEQRTQCLITMLAYPSISFACGSDPDKFQVLYGTVI